LKAISREREEKVERLDNKDREEDFV